MKKLGFGVFVFLCVFFVIFCVFVSQVCSSRSSNELNERIVQFSPISRWDSYFSLNWVNRGRLKLESVHEKKRKRKLRKKFLIRRPEVTNDEVED